MIQECQNKIPKIEQKKIVTYVIYMIGQSITAIGSNIVSFAITWWIASFTQSAFILSTSYIVYMVPNIIVALFGGVLIDRYRKKNIIIIADSLQASATLCIILFLFSKNVVVWIYIFNFLRGIGQGFHTPCANALLTEVVPPQKLKNMNSVRYLFAYCNNIFSPLIAAFLFDHLSFRFILWIDIITFGISVIMIFPLPLSSKKNNRKRCRYWDEFKDGFRIIWTLKPIASAVIHCTLLNLLFTPFLLYMPLYIVETYNNSVNYAIWLIAYQLGSIGGSIYHSVIPKKSTGFKYLSNSVFVFIGGIFFPIISFLFSIEVSFIVNIGILFTIGFFYSALSVQYISLVQSNVQKEQQGRFFAFETVITYSVIPLATILSGIMVSTISLTATYLIFNLSGLLTTGVFFHTSLTKLAQKIPKD